MRRRQHHRVPDAEAQSRTPALHPAETPNTAVRSVGRASPNCVRAHRAGPKPGEYSGVVASHRLDGVHRRPSWTVRRRPQEPRPIARPIDRHRQTRLPREALMGCTPDLPTTVVVELLGADLPCNSSLTHRPTVHAQDSRRLTPRSDPGYACAATIALRWAASRLARNGTWTSMDKLVWRREGRSHGAAAPPVLMSAQRVMPPCLPLAPEHRTT